MSYKKINLSILESYFFLLQTSIKLYLLIDWFYYRIYDLIEILEHLCIHGHQGTILTKLKIKIFYLYDT